MLLIRILFHLGNIIREFKHYRRIRGMNFKRGGFIYINKHTVSLGNIIQECKPSRRIRAMNYRIEEDYI